jgi:hypothetical protein
MGCFRIKVFWTVIGGLEMTGDGFLVLNARKREGRP